MGERRTTHWVRRWQDGVGRLSKEGTERRWRGWEWERRERRGRRKKRRRKRDKGSCVHPPTRSSQWTRCPPCGRCSTRRLSTWRPVEDIARTFVRCVKCTANSKPC